MKEFYVYALLDPRKKFNKENLPYEPFYIGKGKGDRLTEHALGIDTNNQRKVQIIKDIQNEDLEPIERIIYYYEDENDAYDHEDRLISLFGRFDLDKKGILANVAKNNRPSSDLLKGKTYEEIYGQEGADRKKQLMSNTQLKNERGIIRKATPTTFKKNHVPWNKGVIGCFSQETRNQMSQSRKGRIPWNKDKKGQYTEEAKKNISLAAKNREKVTCPHCNKTGSISPMKRWHFNNCRFK